ncbi:MAG TPA: site-2 protease family protein, partial [Phycisphaerales bacterium]|nr:site-2 protease family protein [Phycisphaerales bacterium]
MPQSWWASDVLERGGPVLLYSWVVLVMVSIVLHELAHGWAAIRLGDDTPIHAGHMTLNPLVHMGPVSLLVFALAGIAWGAMPVDPSRIRGRHGEALMAFAGPAMNLLLALIFAALAALLVALADRGVIPPLARSELAGHGWAFFSLGVMLNLALAIFNLAPVAPLDGSRVLSS